MNLYTAKPNTPRSPDKTVDLEEDPLVVGLDVTVGATLAVGATLDSTGAGVGVAEGALGSIGAEVTGGAVSPAGAEVVGEIVVGIMETEGATGEGVLGSTGVTASQSISHPNTLVDRQFPNSLPSSSQAVQHDA